MCSSLSQGRFLGPPKMVRQPYMKDPERDPNLENYLYYTTKTLKIVRHPYIKDPKRDPSIENYLYSTTKTLFLPPYKGP